MVASAEEPQGPIAVGNERFFNQRGQRACSPRRHRFWGDQHAKALAPRQPTFVTRQLQTARRRRSDLSETTRTHHMFKRMLGCGNTCQKGVCLHSASGHPALPKFGKRECLENNDVVVEDCAGRGSCSPAATGLSGSGLFDVIRRRFAASCTGHQTNGNNNGTRGIHRIFNFWHDSYHVSSHNLEQFPACCPWLSMLPAARHRTPFCPARCPARCPPRCPPRCSPCCHSQSR